MMQSGVLTQLAPNHFFRHRFTFWLIFASFCRFFRLMFKFGYAYMCRLLYVVLQGDDLRMPAIEVGRICVKQAGRENGKKCVVIDVMDKSFVLVTGPKKVTGVKRRRVNINHVMPLQEKIEVKRGASDDEVAQVLEAAGKLQEMTQTVKAA